MSDFLPIAMFHATGETLERLPENDSLVLDAMNVFAECEDNDPRLMFIVAAARMEKAIRETIDTFRPGARGHRFRQRIAAARRLGLIEVDLAGYLDRMRLVRNQIAHEPTDRYTIEREPHIKLVRRMHEATRDVPVWSHPAEPDDDLPRCLFATLLSGVLACELCFFDASGKLVPKGFQRLREYAESRPEIAVEE